MAWNVERGCHLDVWAALPAMRSADLLLLCEVDVGMARSGNRHVARELAAELGLGFAFAPHFRELTRGTRMEQRATRGQKNAEALMGIAILSRLPIAWARSAALPDEFDWSRAAERREGGRAVLLVGLETPSGAPLTAVCTHLECYSEPVGRARQLRAALAEVPDGRCILGGDLNSSTAHHSSPRSLGRLALRLLARPTRLTDPTGEEPLFNDLFAAGFSHQGANATGVGTGVPHILPFLPARLRPRVDWILLRDLEPVPGSAAVLATPRVGMRRLSEHDGVGASVHLV